MLLLRRLLFFSVILFTSGHIAMAGVTGKITGTVKDAETGEVLPGVNVILQGTSRGAATDVSGQYTILNIPPGRYTLKVSYIGYADFSVRNIIVNIDQTTTIDFALKAEVIAGEEVTVVATRPVVDKDVSSSQTNVTARQIDNIPAAKNINDVVSLQAGIVQGEDGAIIRGGGADQTAFVVDGFTQRDERTNLPFTQVSLSSVDAIQIQTGGFNAEYGNIRSGLINVVTKEGDRQRYSGSVTYNHTPPAQKNFGPSPYDPDSYWLRPYLDDDVAWSGTENGAWSEHMQNQYPKFSGGWEAIALQTLQDDDPNNDLTPEAAQRVFLYQHRRTGNIRKPDFDIDFGLGGPVPLVSKPLGNLRFFLSHRSEREMYLIPLSTDNYFEQVSMLKLTSNIRQNMKLSITGQLSRITGTNDNNIGNAGVFKTPLSIARVLSQRSYINTIMYAPEYFAPTTIDRYLLGVKFSHTLSSKTFYEISLDKNATTYNTSPNKLRDLIPVVTIGNNYQLDEQPYGFMPYPSSAIDGMRMGVGMSNSRDSSYIATTTARFDITSQVNHTNMIKAGVEFVYNAHKIRYGAIDITLPSGRPSSNWDKNPIRLSAYIQDKLEFKGMIANLGIRFDLSDARDRWYDLDTFDSDFFGNSYNEDFDEQFPRKATKKQFDISPRLGISHPITDNSKLYFNYGHFQSIPVAERLYTIRRVTAGAVSRFADPNLELSRTIAYELGYDHNIADNYLFHTSAYYKDVSDQPNWVRYISSDNKSNYFKSSTNSYADIRGFEVSIEKRTSGWFSGFLNYTYEVTTSGIFGTRRVYQNPADQNNYNRDNPQDRYQTRPISRPYFRGNLTVETPAGFGPALTKIHPFEKIKLSLLPTWRAGRYTTWTRGAILPGVQYNIKWPDQKNVDLRLSKDLRAGRLNFRLYMDVTNLFNNKNFTYDPQRGIGLAFSHGQDFRDYMDSLLWPKEIGKPIGYTEFGNDKMGDLRPDDVEYDPLESNPTNDPAIEARNEQRRKTKSYIDNPNLKWLYYLNPRAYRFGIKIDF